MLHLEAGPITMELGSSHNGCEISAIFGVKLPKLVYLPMNLRSSVQVVGLSTATVAEVLWGSVVTPSWLITCPRNVSAELTLFLIECDSYTPNLLQGYMETSVMLLLSTAKNQHIIYMCHRTPS